MKVLITLIIVSGCVLCAYFYYLGQSAAHPSTTTAAAPSPGDADIGRQWREEKQRAWAQRMAVIKLSNDVSATMKPLYNKNHTIADMQAVKNNLNSISAINCPPDMVQAFDEYRDATSAVIVLLQSQDDNAPLEFAKGFINGFTLNIGGAIDDANRSKQEWERIRDRENRARSNFNALIDKYAK